MAKQKTIDEYVDGLGGWRGEVVSSLRRLVLDAAPDAAESIKWAQPVYEDNGPFCYIKAFDNQVNFGFWRGRRDARLRRTPRGLGGQDAAHKAARGRRHPRRNISGAGPICGGAEPVAGEPEEALVTRLPDGVGGTTRHGQLFGVYRYLDQRWLA